MDKQSKIKMNEKVLYDETIRSKSYQKSINLFYYNISSKSKAEVQNIIENNNEIKLFYLKKIMKIKLVKIIIVKY